MRLGLTLGVAGMAFPAVLDAARRAEAAGFDLLALGEAAHDAFASAAAVAAVTDRVRIVNAVATWVRPPVATARAAATLDEVAQGRYTLGLGTMPAAWNERFYGIPADRPLARMREYVQVVRAALRASPASPVHHQGEAYRVDAYVPLHPPARPDLGIHLAATRPGMARLAGEIADGVVFNVVHTPAYLRSELLPALDAGRGDRPLERGVMVRCVIEEDPERALRMARGNLRLYLDVPYLYEVAAHAGFDLRAMRAWARAGDTEGALAAAPEGLARAMCLMGSAEQCRAQLARYDGLADWVDLAPASGLPPVVLAEQTERIITTFGSPPPPAGRSPGGCPGSPTTGPG